eukprot:jgi/Ulvmu1/9895/UM057_0052.1
MPSARQIVPLLNRILVEKLAPASKTVGGIMLPETAVAKLQEGVVIAAGPGLRTNEGVTLPMSLKAGDRVVLPSYGGTEMKLEDKDVVLYSEDDILAKVNHDA